MGNKIKIRNLEYPLKSQIVSYKMENGTIRLFIDINTDEVEFLGCNPIIRLYNEEGFNTGVKTLKELAGKEFVWEKSVKNGDGSGILYVNEHEQIISCKLNILKADEKEIHINWSGKADINWTEDYDYNVPFEAIFRASVYEIKNKDNIAQENSSNSDVIKNVSAETKTSNMDCVVVRNSAVLHGVINTQNFTTLSKNSKTLFNNKAKEGGFVVLLPVEVSIEEYREREIKVASFCKVISVTEKANKETEVKFQCVNLCMVKNLTVDKEFILKADIELLSENQFINSVDEQGLVTTIRNQFKEYLLHDAAVSVSDIEKVKNATSIDNFIMNLVITAKFDLVSKRKLINELNPINRLQILSSYLETRIFEQSTEKGQDLISFYKERLNNLIIDADVKKRIYLEMNRLKTMQKTQSEYANTVDWLDRVLAFPWDTETEDNKDLKKARDVLNGSHYGMEKLKQRILDLIAVRKYAKKQPPQILCLYGPPGVGKSTIAKSIAEALGKKYNSISLGGLRGSTEISGMKKFFIGAKPGMIIEGITNAGSKNCVLLLDEIDKMGLASNNGDPAAVLLQVLDRNQNNAYKDIYFDIPVDLSSVFFIATANELSTIPAPLLNRLEILTLDGYSLNEKVHIVNNYIIRKVMREFGFEENIIKMSAETIAIMIEQYTFESGVRQLENIVREVCRKHIAECALADIPLKFVELTIQDINRLADGFYEEEPNMAQEGEIGVVNKMSVQNGNIGSVNRLEAVITEGKGEQVISDNIVGTAKSTFKTVSGLLQYRAKEWGIPNEIFTKYNIHVHSPIHEMKHDGSSGGVADIICIFSAIKNIPVDHKIAFTGAISLKGKVMQIGGVKEKVLAAQRSKIKTVVLPLANKKDVDKLPLDVTGNLEFKFFEDMMDVVEFVFGKN